MLDIATSNSVVATNIKRIIEERGLKQSSIAKKAGFSTQGLNDMLNGRRLMRAAEIAAVIDVLDVDANELFKSLPDKQAESV